MAESNTILAYYLNQRSPGAVASKVGVQTFLLHLALADAPDPLSIDAIENQIKAIANQPISPVPREELEALAESCCAEGRIVKRDGGYELSQSRQQLMQSLINQYREDQEVFRQGLIQSVEDSLQDTLTVEEQESMVSAVEQAVQDFFWKNSVEVGNEFQQAEGFVPQIVQNRSGVLWDEIESKLTLVTHDIPMRKVLVEDGIIEFFSAFSGESTRYICSLYSRVVYHQLLQMDPKILEYQKELVAGKVLYTDTNVLLELLFGEDAPAGMATKEVVEASIQAGCTVVYSPATLDELSFYIGRADKRQKAFESASLGLFARSDDVVLAAFDRKRLENRGLQWTGFITPFLRIEEFLADKYGIKMRDECAEGLAEDESYAKVWRCIHDAKAPVSPPIVDHDACNFLLVHRLREKIGSEEDPEERVWLLTQDGKLREAERALRHEFPLPHCMQFSDWGTSLMRLQYVSGFRFEDYVSYLVGSQLGALSEDKDHFEVSFLEAARSAGIDIAGLVGLDHRWAARTIAAVEKDLRAQELLQHARGARDDEIAEIQGEFDARVKHVMEDLKKLDDQKEIERLLRVIERLNKAVQDERAGSKAQTDRLRVEIGQQAEQAHRDRQESQEQRREMIDTVRQLNQNVAALTDALRRQERLTDELQEDLRLRATFRGRVLSLFGFEPRKKVCHRTEEGIDKTD